MTFAIRLAEPADAAAIQRVYAPVVETSVISFETVAPSVEEVARRVAELRLTHPWLVCTADEALVGYAYASTHNPRAAYVWSVNVSVYVSAEWRGRHVGRALYTSLFRILSAQGFVRAYAGITLPNEASQRLHESLDFTPVGVFHHAGYKFGAWHDVGWWERALRPPEEDPQHPMAVGDVVSMDRFHEAINAGLRELEPQR